MHHAIHRHVVLVVDASCLWLAYFVVGMVLLWSCSCCLLGLVGGGSGGGLVVVCGHGSSSSVLLWCHRMMEVLCYGHTVVIVGGCSCLLYGCHVTVREVAPACGVKEALGEGCLCTHLHTADRDNNMCPHCLDNVAMPHHLCHAPLTQHLLIQLLGW